MNKKIGPLLLSGLMIGPILGSGIILLPPLAYGKLGPSTIWAWITIMGLGAIFALIFSKLSVLYPGDGGMTIAIEKSIGKKLKLYASLLMISAVSFGPSAVMLTASDYLVMLKPFENIPTAIIAILLVVLCFVLLLKDLKFISTLSFILSTAIAIILLLSSIVILVQQPIIITPLTETNPIELGRVVLILFWAIIGWEIVGNYSEQVKDLKKTIPKATAISLVIITIIYLVVALAIQTFSYTNELSLVNILVPTFGGQSILILALLVTGLCVCTYLLIVGALARLVNALASEGHFHKLLSGKNSNDIPVYGVIYFIISHATVLTLTYFELIDIEIIVSIANGFFLANALIGLIAAYKIIDSLMYKIGAVLLSVSLLAILLLSNALIFVALIAVYIVAQILYSKSQKINHLANDGV